MLQKKNKNKNVYYKPGDAIFFRVKDKRSKIGGKILAIEDSVIVFIGNRVPVDNITSLYIDENTRWWFRYKVEQLCLIAGTGYLGLDLINTSELTKETLTISGLAIGTGLLAKLLIGNRIKIGGKTRVRVLQL